MSSSVTRPRLIGVALAGAVVLTGCTAAAARPSPAAGDASGPTPTPFVDWIGTVDPNPTDPPWFDVVMTDVNSGQRFKISDFKGKVILVETMATWCPACQGEMGQVKDLIAALGPDANFVAVSLDVDSNEDALILKRFAEKNGFDWRIAISPQEVSRFLATNYDVDYLNPPLQPMLVIDHKGGVWGLPFGTKSSISLKKTIDEFLAGKS
jgi:thiol-disulfide isomerase/thioredoxin